MRYYQLQESGPGVGFVVVYSFYLKIEIVY